MPNVNVTHSHDLGIDKAKAAVILTIVTLLERFPEEATTLEQNWNDDTMTFSFIYAGQKITGTCVVTANSITIQSDLPFPLSLGANFVESQIKTYAAEYLKLVA